MASPSALLADMDKAITEMEVALAVIKPEFRAARATALAAGVGAGTNRSAHSRKRSSSEKKEDKRLRKERKDRERFERRAKREELKAAELLKAGRSSQKKPAPARHHSDPSVPALPQAVEVARLTTPLPGANGSGDLLSPASASSSGRERSGTVGSSSSKHKGLRGIFRKTSSGSHHAPPVPPLPAGGLAVNVHPPLSSPTESPQRFSSPQGLSVPTGFSGLPPPSPPFDPTTPTASAFSRHSHISLPMPGPPPSPDKSRPSTSKRSSSISRQAIMAPSILADLYPAIDQLDISLNNLRAMHSTLLDEARRSRVSQPAGLSDFEQYRLSVVGRQSSEAGTLRGDEQRTGARLLGAGSSNYLEDDNRLPALRTHQRAASTSSRLSSVLSVWYDAEVMPEVDEPIDEAEEDAALARVDISIEDDSSSGSSDDEDDFEEAGSVLLGPSASPRGQVYARSASLSASDSTASSPALSSPPATEVSRFSYETARPEDSNSIDHRQAPDPAEVEMPVVQWRTRLPVPMPKDEGSLISVLRKSVGKDMSQISMPVTFNEAISLLQRAAEEIEYSKLLTLAAHAVDPAERLSHVAAFAVSSYASSRYRSSRKPFNPMLGETYELVRDGVRFVAEKTSHHPPVIASHADGPGWSMWQTSAAKNKLAGMSLEITPVGATFIELKSTGERFRYEKPSSYIRNLVAGTKYLETIGTMDVANLTTSDSCRLTFKEGGWGGSGRNVVSGTVTSAATGKKVAWIDGKWDSKLDIKYGPHDPAHLLWETHPWPPNAEKYYGWTYFTMTLNQLDPSFADLLPRSDSRFNPAQRALEEGRLDEAEQAKLALETKQRARNKAREERGERWTPRFFEEAASGEGYVYKGGYWEARRDGTFEDLDLW